MIKNIIIHIYIYIYIEDISYENDNFIWECENTISALRLKLRAMIKIAN
jgi:hypothetical protein